MIEDVAFEIFTTFYIHEKSSKLTARQYFDNLDATIKQIWLTAAQKAVKIQS